MQVSRFCNLLAKMPKSGLIINTFELDKLSSLMLFVAIERSRVVSFCADVGTAVSVLIGGEIEESRN